MDRNKVLELARKADLYMTSDERIAAVERFAALIERELCGDAEPVAWSVFDKRTKKHWYTNESKYEAQHYAKEYAHHEPDNTLSMVAVPLYTHPTPAVVQQLVDGLAGLIDFIEIDNLKIDQDAFRIAKAALAAAKDSGL